MAVPRTKDLDQQISTEDLAGLIAAGESDLIEFKRQWYDLEQPEGKARLTQDVLALANTVRPDAPGFLLIGVDDERTVVGVQEPPDPETITSILANYIHPPADVRCRHYEIGGCTVSVLAVSWSPARPHYSPRQYPGVLTKEVVYVRRDRTTGTLTLPEIEVLIREKDARFGPLISRQPIQCSFVQKAETYKGSGLVTRVTNVTTEPVGGVDVMFDVRNARNPELFYRARKLGNATLRPGESREVELPMNEVQFYLVTFDRSTGERKWTNVSNLGAHMGDRWLDATLHVDYRDRDGFVRHLEQRVALDA
jgi:hypothetical protein